MPPIMIEERELAELDELIKTTTARATVARAAADKVLADARTEGKNILTDKDLFAKVDEASKEADDLEDQVLALNATRAKTSKRIAPDPEGDGDGDGNGGDTDPKKAKRPKGVSAASMAKRFMASNAVTDLKDSGQLGQAEQVYNTPAVEVASKEEVIAFLKGGADFRAYTPIDGTDLIEEDQRRMPPVSIPVRQVRLLDLISIRPTTKDIVIWTKETTRTDAAAETAKGTDAPEGAYAYTKQTARVRRVAIFLAAHEEQLDDEPALEAWLSDRLGTAVQRRVELQSVSGNGSGENFLGLYGTSGVGTIAVGSRSIPDTIHMAITTVRVALEDEPDAIGMHPIDWEAYLLEKDIDGRYLHLGSTLGSVPETAWGKTVIVSTVFTQGSPIVGKWSWLVLYVRSGLTTLMTNNYGDFFRKFLIAFRSSMRAISVVEQPKAFCIVTGVVDES